MEEKEADKVSTNFRLKVNNTCSKVQIQCDFVTCVSYRVKERREILIKGGLIITTPKWESNICPAVIETFCSLVNRTSTSGGMVPEENLKRNSVRCC